MLKLIEIFLYLVVKQASRSKKSLKVSACDNLPQSRSNFDEKYIQTSNLEDNK